MWWSANTSAMSTSTDLQRFIVPKGASAEKIGATLETEGLIKNALAFKIWVQLFGKQNSINAGEFQLSPDMNIEEIIVALGKGPQELWVTIPEGLRREEVVERIIDGLAMDDAQTTEFRSKFLVLTENQEGYLFPDTYLFPSEITAEKVAQTLRLTFDTKFDEKMRSDADEKGLTMSEVVTLASIIEKETKTDKERPIVAGIYFNRLGVGQAIQADATAQYPLGTIRCAEVVGDCDWWKVPTRLDLEVDSPYNTYMHAGIPPAPISSPGLSSLKAVVYSEVSPYFYYIHDDSGQIYYAETLEGHNRNVQQYLR